MHDTRAERACTLCDVSLWSLDRPEAYPTRAEADSIPSDCNTTAILFSAFL